jgi:uncharacterized membrane protein
MTTAVAARWQWGLSADAALDLSARLWWLVTALGQWIFVAYVASFYIPLLSLGGLPALQKSHLANGFMPGDSVGNAAVAGHILLTIILLGGGPLQLLPQIRARFPAFHRWLGRTYLLTAAASASAGLYLIWTRPLFGPLVTNIATSIDGALIIVCACFAVRYAIARDIRNHRRWALRLFMVVSGVWFLRIGFRTWDLLTGGIGVDDEGFGGPFLVAWHYGQFLLPLAILELYFRARASSSARHGYAMAAGLVVVAVLMAIGIYQATLNSWLPRVTGAM